jgi:transmembrane sensor
VRKISFARIAAAAVVLLLVTAGGWLWLTRTPKTQVATLEATNGDVAPGGNKALLTLANGSAIVLDNLANGIVAQQGNVKVLKPGDGQLTYSPSIPTASGGEALYNTLSTPKGGEYTIILPDGSQVWLNAASSITYPTVFNIKERKVQVTGEAYFEVAKLITADGRKRVPFIVDISSPTGGGREGALGRIEVLGTHFNINAYDDESAMKTTLLEGKVKASMVNGEWSILKPGQQAAIHHSQLTIHDKVDLESTMAWKNGLFHYENTDIQTVMRQLSRWYNVEVVYKRDLDKDDPLFFEVSRHTNLSDVLKVLNLAGGARFSIENRKIIVQ